jgi:cation diffusion facilitator family transporter
LLQFLTGHCLQIHLSSPAVSLAGQWFHCELDALSELVLQTKIRNGFEPRHLSDAALIDYAFHPIGKPKANPEPLPDGQPSNVAELQNTHVSVTVTIPDRSGKSGILPSVANSDRMGVKVAITGMVVSGLLAAVKIITGWLAGSTSVVADGVESAADVLASDVVLFGLMAAARPPDKDHPYGHGRLETLSGLTVGFLLAMVGIAICVRSLKGVTGVHPPPKLYAIWPLIGSIAAKAILSWSKFHVGRKVQSAGLVADAWNDAVDIVSGSTALAALGLTLYDPSRFLAADHYGGFAVGLIVITLGIHVVRDASLQLMDTMPDESKMSEIRRVASLVPGALGVEKCFARKTGLKYHVDLHLEVDPGLTVRESHEIATRVRSQLKDQLDWVADVLVHVEPYQP